MSRLWKAKGSTFHSVVSNSGKTGKESSKEVVLAIELQRGRGHGKSLDGELACDGSREEPISRDVIIQVKSASS